MLKELVEYVSGPIALLLNKTMKEGVIPKDWKQAYVIPIYKKGAKSQAENYRPISLTSIVCKLMETFIKQVIMEHLLSNKLISPKQFGFISGRLTTLQLLKYLDQCIEKISDGEVVDSIYLDFAKAFDSVPHRRMISKLHSYGIKGYILDWIKDFVRTRTQVVKVNGKNSSAVPLLSGIPQGSVLGPILFIIYINDLLDNISSNELLFADDTKIFAGIKSREDAETLQADINNLEKWSQTWLLSFNPKKCHVLTLGKFDNIRHTKRYTMYASEIEHVFDEKDLGITIDSELKFEDHISLKLKKANNMVGLIRRSFSHLRCDLFKQLYISFVRPHLEYAQAVWSSHLRKHINMIENAQMRATKLLDGMGNLNYAERLKKLDLPTLVYRRARGDMIEIYKHFHTYDGEMPSSFQPRNRPSRKHDFQLYQRTQKDGKRGVQSNFLYYRSSKIWNELPKEVTHAKSMNMFKNALDRYWVNETTKFDHRPHTSDS